MTPRTRRLALGLPATVAALASLVAAPALAHTLHVPEEFPTIQYALFAAAPGDTIRVAPGTYGGSLLWPPTQSVHLMSEAGPGATILDGLGTNRVIRFESPVDSTSLVAGFTITRGNGEMGGGILCLESSPTIRGNRITGNTAMFYGGGIQCDGLTCSPVIRDNEIDDNLVVDGSGGGVCAYNDASPIVVGNDIHDNHADAYYGGGMHCEAYTGSGGATRIERNRFHANSAHGGGGLSVWNPFVAAPEVRENEIYENQAYVGGGFYSFWSLANLVGDRLHDNHAGLAGAGLLAEESHDLSLVDCVITRNVAVGYAGGMALVHWCHGPVVTGCTITENEGSSGGGLYIYYDTYTTLQHCLIARNTATVRGGAIYSEMWCRPTLLETEVLDNHAPEGGGLVLSEAQPTITDCTFSGNEAAAVRITLGWADHPGAIHQCAIAGNGYGVRNDDAAVPLAAESNWWGDASGPYHPRENPDGLGDPVSDYVSFVPWLTEPGGASAVADGGPVADPLGRLGPRITCAPNPFHGSTTIEYRVPDCGPAAGPARLEIYDVTGRCVRRYRLADARDGGGRIVWNGDDERGTRLPGAVHFLRLETGARHADATAIRLP